MPVKLPGMIGNATKHAVVRRAVGTPENYPTLFLPPPLGRNVHVPRMPGMGPKQPVNCDSDVSLPACGEGIHWYQKIYVNSI